MKEAEKVIAELNKSARKINPRRNVKKKPAKPVRKKKNKKKKKGRR